MSEITSKIIEANGAKELILEGFLNESADLTFMSQLPQGKILVNSKDLKRINSCGVREWITALKTVPATSELIFVQCSAAFLDQINMISNFTGNGKVKSLYATYACSECKAKKEVLIDLDSCLKNDELNLPEETCSACNKPMEFGDDPASIFGFLE